MDLKTYLAETGQTNTAFAELIGVSPMAVSRYVRRERRPRDEVLIKIREVTNGRITPNDFYGMAADESEAA